jgi:hypothetical protein
VTVFAQQHNAARFDAAHRNEGSEALEVTGIEEEFARSRWSGSALGSIRDLAAVSMPETTRFRGSSSFADWALANYFNSR